jgi:light-harvesting complex 1 beta chain
MPSWVNPLKTKSFIQHDWMKVAVLAPFLAAQDCRHRATAPFAETIMANLKERAPVSSGLSEDEAREFHGYFITLMTLFISVALVAHLLMWMWRPWFNVTVN